MSVENKSIKSDESRIFLWGGAAVGGSGLLWIIPGLNAVFSVAAIAALVLIVSRLGYLRAILGCAGRAYSCDRYHDPLYGGIDWSAQRSRIRCGSCCSRYYAWVVASRSLSSAVKTIWYGAIPILILFALILTFYSSLVRSIPSITRQVNTITGIEY